jgi:hypothetical protein
MRIHSCSGDAQADPGAHECRRPHQRRGQEPFAGQELPGKKKEWIFFIFFAGHHSSVASVLTSPFILNILGGPSEVSSPHSAAELGGGGGPKRRHQRRCAAGRTAVRRGGGHLGATAGVRRRCRCRCGSRSAAAAGAPSRRRVGNDDDNNRRQGVRAGGDDVDARTATASASGEAVEQLLRRAAQRGRLLWLAGRVVVVVADRLCLMKRRRSVGRQLGF